MCLRNLVRLLLLFSALPMYGQFGGPYPIVANDASGALRNTPGPLAAFTSFHHLAGLTGIRGVLEVNSMVVDHDHAFWLGTTTGLVRLDGQRHTRYVHEAGLENSLPNDHVTTVALDDRGRLWMATMGGLGRYDPLTDSIERISLHQEGTDPIWANQVSNLQFGFGRLWASTWDGIFMIDPVALEPRRILPTGTVDRAPYKGGAHIRGLTFPSDGSHPVIATTDGILRIHPESGNTEPFVQGDVPMPIQPVQLYPAPFGRVWCYDRRRELVTLIDPVMGIIDSLPQLLHSTSHDLVHAVYDDHQGVVWVSFRNGGVYAINMAEREVYQLRFGPISGERDGLVNVHEFRAGERGDLWLASDAGLIVLRAVEPGLVHVDLPELAPPHSIMCMSMGPHGELLLGTRGDGIRWRDMATGTWHVVRNGSAESGSRLHNGLNTIFDIAHLGGDRYAVGTLGGLSIMEMGKGSLERVPMEVQGPRSLASVALALAPNGRLWSATMAKGLQEVDTATWTVLRHFTLEDSIHHLPGHSIATLHMDPAGDLWAGTMDGDGLLRLPAGGDRFETIPSPDGQPFGQVVTIVIPRPGIIMMTTLMDGVVILDLAQGKVDRITISDGLPGPQVRRIVEHPSLGMWIGGILGIARLEGRQAVPLEIRMLRDHYSGLLVIDTLRKVLCIADGARLMELSIGAAAPKAVIPKVKLLGVRVNTLLVPSNTRMDLVAFQDRIEFELSVQDPLLAPSTRLAYRLLPDTAWSECLGCGELVFARLPEGQHRLEARVLGSSGQWGPTMVLTSFHVRPPMWRTWWAQVLMAFAAVTLLVLLFRWRLMRRTAHLRIRYEQERILAEERLRIANDLHDEIGSGLSVIKVKSQLALERPDVHSSTEMLKQVAESSTEMIDAMRQMIWAIRSGQPQLADLLAYMRGYASKYLADHDIRCDFSIVGNPADHELTVEQRRALLLILKEALHNVVKHSGASVVHISASIDGPLRLRIHDDGRGIGADELASSVGVGFQSMQQRAASIGGRLEVRSGPGTILDLQVPL